MGGLCLQHHTAPRHLCPALGQLLEELGGTGEGDRLCRVVHWHPLIYSGSATMAELLA